MTNRPKDLEIKASLLDKRFVSVRLNNLIAKELEDYWYPEEER